MSTALNSGSVLDAAAAAAACDIAVFIRALEGGGAQRDAVLLANALAERGAAVVVLTLLPDGPLATLVSPAVPVIHVRASSLRACLPALRATILRLAPQVVLSSEAAQNVMTALTFATLPQSTRPRLILREVTSPSHARLHDPYVQNRLAYRVMGAACRRADCVLTLTQGARTDLVDNFAVPAERISVIGSNAVIDPATLARLAAFDGEAGRETGLIVAVGRLSPEKDHLTLIEAMAKLPASVRLAIVGEGPMRPALEARIADLQLGDRVHLAGFTPDPFAWHMRAALSVTSSRFEGLGNAIIEALACGTPVVSTDCPYGPREILANGTFGRLVPVGDATAMAQAIIAGLAEAPDRHALRARAGLYTAAAAAKAFEAILQERGLIGAKFASAQGNGAPGNGLQGTCEPAMARKGDLQVRTWAMPLQMARGASTAFDSPRATTAPRVATGLYHSALRGAAKHLVTKPFVLANPRPMVSFTFDDVPDSAFHNGARVLDQHGTRGTFYIAPGTCGVQDQHWRVISRADVTALAASGHEIGAHTFSHVRVEPLGARQMADETRRCQEALAELCPASRIENFAYPFGGISLPRKLELQATFASCRGIYSGINAGRVDLGVLAAEGLYDRTLTDAHLTHLLDETERRNGWLIFYTHDVAVSPSWIGCSPALLDRVVRAVKARGIETLAITDALDRAGYKRTTGRT
jgi:glycosyltransferase involved in cell wall biosynthesis/peptidoglycan/xylan/chitin deacetylase (PgdA/CDA1 family)